MKMTGILGVAIITLLIIIIASITYAHVESIREQQMKKKNQFIQGLVSSIKQRETISYQNNEYKVWNTTLIDQNNDHKQYNYQMIFDETYPPQSGVSLRFYYITFTIDNTKYYSITEIDRI